MIKYPLLITVLQSFGIQWLFLVKKIHKDDNAGTSSSSYEIVLTKYRLKDHAAIDAYIDRPLIFHTIMIEFMSEMHHFVLLKQPANFKHK